MKKIKATVQLTGMLLVCLTVLHVSTGLAQSQSTTQQSTSDQSLMSTLAGAASGLWTSIVGWLEADAPDGLMERKHHQPADDAVNLS